MTQNINSPLSQEDFELVEHYLNGQLDAVQQDEIQKRLDSDPIFAGQVEEIRDLRLGIERAALGSRLDSFHSEIEEIQVEVPGKSIRPFSFWGIAASIFLVVSAGTWWIMGQKSPGEERFQAYFRPDPGLVTTMSVGQQYEFDRGMVDYKEGNYTEAIVRWEKLLAEKSASDTLNYFLGASYLSADQESKSLEYLEPVASNPQSSFYSEANWYAGLAALKLGEKEKALKFLNASSRPQAQQLISELESN
jgi:tetratricopeptide (TPR) repeat protein